MITESTGIPDADTSATTTAEPASQPATTPQEPSQETVLAELRTARKEGKELDLSATAPNAEPAKAEPPKDPAQKSNEQKLKEKHGENYKPSQDRQKHKAKIEEMGRRIAELESKWKDTQITAENQMEFTRTSSSTKCSSKR